MDKSLGKRIEECRNKKGLSLAKLARLCEITSMYLRQIESGNMMPSLNLFISICNQLEASPSYLLQDMVVCNDLCKCSEQKEFLDKCSPKQENMFVAILKKAIKHTR